MAVFFLPPSLPEACWRRPAGAGASALSGDSAGALRLPLRAPVLSMALVGTSGVLLSGSCSGSLPDETCEMKLRARLRGQR